MGSKRENVARAIWEHFPEKLPAFEELGAIYTAAIWRMADAAIEALDASRAAPGDAEGMAVELRGVFWSGDAAPPPLGSWPNVARHVAARIAAAVAAERERAAKVCKDYAADMANMSLDGDPDAARLRESMEATATRLSAAIRSGAPADE